MIVGCLIYLFAVLLNKVSLEYTVKGFVGLPAVLNCSYTADKNKVHKVDWVYNHTYTVYAFSPGSLQNNPDNTKFQSIPEEHKDGIYSIEIKKVEKSDEGVYTCIITPADYYTNIQLIIEESHQENTDEGNKKTSERVTTVCVVVAVLFVVILLIVCIKIAYVGHIRKMYASYCLRSDY